MLVIVTDKNAHSVWLSHSESFYYLLYLSASLSAEITVYVTMLETVPSVPVAYYAKDIHLLSNWFFEDLKS